MLLVAVVVNYTFLGAISKSSRAFRTNTLNLAFNFLKLRLKGVVVDVWTVEIGFPVPNVFRGVLVGCLVGVVSCDVLCSAAGVMCLGGLVCPLGCAVTGVIRVIHAPTLSAPVQSAQLPGALFRGSRRRSSVDFPAPAAPCLTVLCSVCQSGGVVRSVRQPVSVCQSSRLSVGFSVG